MPKVDMDMTAGTIVNWHVAEGGRVERATPLFDIETDKAAMEVESPATGVLGHVVAKAGASVPIGQPVAWIYADGETIGPIPEAPAAVAGPVTVADADDAVAPTAGLDRPAGIRATPSARRLARQHRIDLAGLAGSAVRGRIVRADVERVVGMPPGGLNIVRSGRPSGMPIVWLHGLAADASSWAKLWACLPADQPSLAIELPSHGGSPITAAAGFDALVGEVGRALDDLAFDRCHLVGHSLGGAIAIALADRRAERIASLTLLAPAGLGPEIDMTILGGVLRSTARDSLARWLKELVSDRELVTGSYVAAAHDGRTDAHRRQAQEALAQSIFPDATQAIDLVPALQRVAMPARIVWGRDDKVIPWRHALRAPGQVSLNLFENTGHLPQFERPQAVARLIGSTVQSAVNPGC